jgi:hypothetical protein
MTSGSVRPATPSLPRRKNPIITPPTAKHATLNRSALMENRGIESSNTRLGPAPIAFPHGPRDEPA